MNDSQPELAGGSGMAAEGVLPHRPPFLWVDRVLAVEPGRRAIGVKLITQDEPLLASGRPGVWQAQSQFPQMLLIEAMAQIAGIALLTGSSGQQRQDLVPLFASLDQVEFGPPPRVGDRVEIETQVLQLRATTGRVRGWCRRGGQPVASGTFLFAFRPL